VSGMYEDLSFSVDQSMVTIEDRIAAFDWAEQLIDQEGMNAVTEAFGQSGAELVLALTGDFETAMANGDLALAQRIADNLGIDSLQAQLDEARNAINDTTTTTKESVKDAEDAARVSTENMGKSFEDLALDANTSMTSVNEDTTATSDKLGEDTTKMSDSIIGTAAELLIQSLAMGLSFMAISASSTLMQEGVSASIDLIMADNLLLRDDFALTTQTITSDFDLLNAKTVELSGGMASGLGSSN